jgi:hypothetical protein
MRFRDEQDPLAPQREAAMFYGLFLRGHSVDNLRRDIEVSNAVIEKWRKPNRYNQNFKETLQRIIDYRRQVLAIFDELVLHEKNRARVQ